MKKTVRTLLLLSTLAGLVGCGTKTSETPTDKPTDTTKPTDVVKPTETAKPTEAPHVHTFTGSWKHDETKHWKECDSGDGERSEEAEHRYTDGGHICDVCGYDIYTEYGAFTGSVVLHKREGNVTDYSGVRITASDDSVEISYNETDGTFTINRCKINEAITLTFEKDGYLSTTKTIMALEKGKTEALSKPATLEYQRFTKSIKKNWDADKIDYSHANEEDSYVSFASSSTGHTLIFNTTDSYENVYATWVAKREGISLNDTRMQGMYLFFEEEQKIAPIQLNGSEGNYGFQMNAGFWGAEADNGESYTSVFQNWTGYTLSEEEQAKYKSENGLVLGLLRRGSVLTLMVEGRAVCDLPLPEELASAKCKVGYYSFDTGNAETGIVDLHIDITEDFEAVTSEIETVATDNHGTITDKKKNTIVGEKTDIEIVPNDGYVVSSITNNDIDVTGDFSGGRLMTKAYKTNRIVVNFALRTAGDISADIVGIEFDGKKEKTFADGTVFNLTGSDGIVEATVKGGKLVASDVQSGNYTISKKDDADWCTADIAVTANEKYETKITLSENALQEHFTKWNSNPVDCTDLKNGTFSQTNNCMFVTTKKTYKTAALTYRMQHDLCSGEMQGLIFRFRTGDKQYKYVSLINEKNEKLQFRKEGAADWHVSSSGGGDETQSSLITFWYDIMSFVSDDNNRDWANANQSVLSADELVAFGKESATKLAADELDLTMVRDGINFYAFVGDTYLAKATVPEEYADMEVEVGMWYTGGQNNDRKSFAVSMTSDISSYLEKVNAKA